MTPYVECHQLTPSSFAPNPTESALLSSRRELLDNFRVISSESVLVNLLRLRGDNRPIVLSSEQPPIVSHFPSFARFPFQTQNGFGKLARLVGRHKHPIVPIPNNARNATHLARYYRL